MWICLSVVGVFAAFLVFGWFAANVRDARLTQFKQMLHQLACDRIPGAREATAEEIFQLFCMTQSGLGIYFDPTRRPIDKMAFAAIFHELSAAAGEFQEHRGPRP